MDVFMKPGLARRRHLARVSRWLFVGALLSGLPLSALAQDRVPDAIPAEAARVVHLADVERAARGHQPQMAVARAAVAAAQSRVGAANASYLPQVTGTVQYQRTTGNFAPRPGTVVPAHAVTSLSPSYDLFNYGVSASQLVYDFGQTSNRIGAAKAAREAQEAVEKSTDVQVVFAVRRAYFQALAQKALVGVAQETLDNQHKHLAQIEGFVRAGVRPEIDLVQAHTSISNAEVALITARNGYDGGKVLLNQAAGVVGATDFDVVDEDPPAVEDEDQPLQTLLGKALASRPDLAVYDRQQQQQEQTIGSIRGALWPTVSVTAGATEVGTSLGGTVPNWNIGALLGWPIFQGGLTQAQVAEAEANLQGIHGQRALAVLQIQSDVEQARLAVVATKATMGSAQAAVGSAREQLRLAEARYAAGIGGILELSDAQLAYSSAAVQLIQARYNRATARAQLLAALGRP